MCIRCRIATGYATPTDRWRAKADFEPEVQGVIGEFTAAFVAVVDDIQPGLVRRTAAGDLPIADEAALYDAVFAAFAEYDDEFYDVYRTLGDDGVLVGRELASRIELSKVDFGSIPGRVSDRLDDWATTAAQASRETMSDTVSTVLHRGQEQAGMGLEELSSMLEDDVFDGRLKGSYVQRAARTEGHTLKEMGRHSAFVDDDAIGGERWITMQDDRVRDTHAAVHGEIVAVEDNFSSGLRYPGDIQSPPSDRVNCRCTMEPVSVDDML